eukprot:s129_g38.t2
MVISLADCVYCFVWIHDESTLEHGCFCDGAVNSGSHMDEDGEVIAQLPGEVPFEVQLASTLLPRIGTPSLHSHYHQWNKQLQGSRGQTPCSQPGSEFRSTLSSSLSSLRPHLISRERPPTTGPPLDRRSALQASRPYTVIQDTIRPAAKPKVRFEPKEASAEGELEDYNEKLSEISRRLCQGVAKDERALQWSRLLDASLNFKLPWRDREVRLRVLYHCLYGLADTKVLPSVPTALLTQPCSVEGAETRVEANIEASESLRISLPEALKQLSTQRHPGAYFLLTCHLGKDATRDYPAPFSELRRNYNGDYRQERFLNLTGERLPACQGFPWLTFGVLLLLLGVLCGPNRAERPVAVPSQTWNEVSQFPTAQAGAAQTAAAAPLLLGGALLVTLRRTASSRTQDWSLLLCLGMLSLGAAKSDVRFRHENANFSASCFTSCEGQELQGQASWQKLESASSTCIKAPESQTPRGAQRTWPCPCHVSLPLRVSARRGQQRRGATEAVQIPQSLQVHRRVHGMDVQQSGTISCAIIDAGKNKDLKIERKVVDEADAEEEARRLRELVDAVRHHAAGQGESGKQSREDFDWTSKVEQLLGSYDFFKPLEALQPGLVGRLSKEVIYEEVPADVVIFRQQDEPDGCWVVISGCVGVHLWRNSELLDEEVPTPRDAFDPSSFELKGAPKHQRRKGKLRSNRTFAALPTHLIEEEEPKAESTNPAGSPSGGNKRMLLPRSQTSESMDGKDGKGKDKDKDVPRYRSFEGFSTYTEKSILGVQVAQLGSGRIFGELALQNTKPRAATIKCAEDSAFLRIPYATYQGVVKEIFDEAKAVEESIRILKTSAFFRDLERNSPGLIKELASRGCTKIEERREQVLFRQFDPPNNCYILLEGSVDVFIYKKTKDKSVSLLRKDDQPTPRHQEPIDKKTTITEAANMWKQQKEAEKANKLRPINKKDKNRKFEPWPGEFTRYKTTEGFSTFAKDSKYGKLVTTLKPGAVVGELGLRNNEPRAATIRCAENCKFLVVGKNIFLEVLKECLEMMRFFNLHLPGRLLHATKSLGGTVSRFKF